MGKEKFWLCLLLLKLVLLNVRRGYCRSYCPFNRPSAMFDQPLYLELDYAASRSAGPVNVYQ